MLQISNMCRTANAHREKVSNPHTSSFDSTEQWLHPAVLSSQTSERKRKRKRKRERKRESSPTADPWRKFDTLNQLKKYNCFPHALFKVSTRNLPKSAKLLMSPIAADES